jgi:hypothetical protein
MQSTSFYSFGKYKNLGHNEKAEMSEIFCVGNPNNTAFI